MQTESFYMEANDMEPGWGNYLRKIDKLRERVNGNKGITINQACWIMYAEFGTSASEYLKFKNWTIENKLNKKRFTWQVWGGMFTGWREQQRAINVN